MDKNSKKKLIRIMTHTVDILIIILIIILLVKLFYKNKYGQIEQKYIEAATYIYENNAIEGGINKEKIVLTRKEINSLLNPPVIDNTCNGYVIIYPDNQGPSYKAYITCDDKYTTKGYDEKYII